MPRPDDATTEPISPAHPWDGYLVGEENALAHASAIALARGGAEGVSPLIVHGPSGAGKTRLLAGLVAERIARNPGASVAHLAAEEFAALVGDAADRRGGFGELRDRFRRLDLFVLDDLHSLERSTLALGELAHTLDALEEAGASVAASARVGPGRWSNWPERLVSRLVGGLSVRVDPPGLASRRRFVLERARAKGLRLAAEAVEEIAGRGEDYRALDGLIARAALMAKVEKRPMDRSLASDLLAEDDGTTPGPRQAAERIARAVAERFGVTLRDLRSASRRHALVVPRHLAILMVRRGTSLSFAAIGDFFGKRDAATIRHACDMAEARLANDPAMAAEVAAMGISSSA
jgi:chromosomal replication initiator protein